MLVGDIQRFIQDGDASAKVGFARRARRHHVDAVEVREWPEALLLAEGDDFCHRFRICPRGIERHIGLASLAVAHEFNRPKHAETTHIAH